MRVGVCAVLLLFVAFAAGCDSGDGILCKDGWVSHAENTQGACSSHGGIAAVPVSASPTPEPSPVFVN